MSPDPLILMSQSGTARLLHAVPFQCSAPSIVPPGALASGNEPNSQASLAELAVTAMADRPCRSLAGMAAHPRPFQCRTTGGGVAESHGQVQPSQIDQALSRPGAAIPAGEAASMFAAPVPNTLVSRHPDAAAVAGDVTAWAATAGTERPATTTPATSTPAPRVKIPPIRHIPSHKSCGDMMPKVRPFK